MKKKDVKNNDAMSFLLSKELPEIRRTRKGFKSVIFDEELDPVKCSFYGDGTVKLNAKDYTYLILNIDNLENLIEIIHGTEDIYRKERKKNNL